jgi:hypothetical protein
MANDIVTVVPWGLHPLPQWIIGELNRRSKEYGQNPNMENGKPYSGPRTAWVRFFSNGISRHPEAAKLDGFVMGGTYGFDDSYGFNRNGFNQDNKITIGVDSRGNPHKIPNDRIEHLLSVSNAKNNQNRQVMDFPHRPPPSVESVSCEMAGSNASFPNLCRKITINWKCYSLAQLNYLAPYFLTPRITCLVEWGWNNYDNISLVDLTDLDWINNMFVDPSYTLEWVKKSNGNYDAGLGFITDYSFKLNEAGGYDCHTTIMNANRLIEGEQIHSKEVTEKKGDTRTPLQNFRSFVKDDLNNIDSNKPEYVNKRKDLKLLTKIYEYDEERDGQGLDPYVEVGTKDNIKERVFRMSDKTHPKNKDGFWLRMDLVQDIINAFFEIKMVGTKTATIRQLDIMETVVVASPFLKSSNPNVLIPNRYAPRFTYQNEKSNPGKPSPTPPSGEYERLFKEKIQSLRKKYEFGNIDIFDDLKTAINPGGNSFPIYEDKDIPADGGKTAQKLKSGYWGYLKDIFISADYFKKIVENNDSALKMIEQLLQGINEAFCQICQLKLIPAEYGNQTYSVYDENMAGISTKNDAADLPIITLGSLDSAFMKSVSFDVKISQEMMNQLVFQSANPDEDPDGSTQTKNVAANPITNRYSAGDRLYVKGELPNKSESSNAPSTPTNETPEQRKKRTEVETKQKEKAVKDAQAAKDRKRKIREEGNAESFLIYYVPDPNNKDESYLKKYYICEKYKDFLNYNLTLPNKNAPYLNNGIMPGTTVTIELMGISGINFLSQFLLDHVPPEYSYTTAVWQISDVKQNVEDKNWTTTITAQVRPLTVL